jgi:hypothetical protein
MFPHIEGVQTRDLVAAWLHRYYPNLPCVVIYNPIDTDSSYGWCKQNIPNMFDHIGDDILVVLFADRDRAIEYCESIPDSAPYAVVWYGGEPIYENT